MRPMASDLPRPSTNFCITGSSTMECSLRLVLALCCRFPDFGFTATILSQAIARHRFIPEIILILIVKSLSSSSVTLIHLILLLHCTLISPLIQTSHPHHHFSNIQLKNCGGFGQSQATTISSEVLPHVGRLLPSAPVCN